MPGGDDSVVMPEKIRAHLADRIRRTWPGEAGGAAIDGLPTSMPAGTVARLFGGGPFGWLADGRLDVVDGRVVLELLEDDRMSGPHHYRVWDDGTTEPLESEHTGWASPADASPEEKQRIQDEFYAHNRRVQALLKERGFPR
jgi:hypothetical protein